MAYIVRALYHYHSCVEYPGPDLFIFNSYKSPGRNRYICQLNPISYGTM